MKELKKGSCLCGQIQYEIDGDFESFFLCHCKYCQKDTGSAHAANLFSATAKLRWISGESNIKRFNVPKSRHMKSFCSNCGSAVPSLQNEKKLLVVPAGGMDTEINIRPNAHLFMISQARWSKDLENVKKYSKLPTN